ncbi:MAG: hypothetical protein RL154_1130 [Pseudomonadota bacterium]|jgi:hypothetical protein
MCEIVLIVVVGACVLLAYIIYNQHIEIQNLKLPQCDTLFEDEEEQKERVKFKDISTEEIISEVEHRLDTYRPIFEPLSMQLCKRFSSNSNNDLDKFFIEIDQFDYENAKITFKQIIQKLRNDA